MVVAPPPPAPAAVPADAGGHVITNPSWLAIPNGDQMAAVWPRLGQATSGMGKIRCKVAVSGALTGCTLIAEDPPGVGFGAAALLLAPTFQLRPRLIDGKPVSGAEVVIPIRFESRGGNPGGQRVNMMPWAPWLRTPSIAEVRAAYPAKALADGVRGLVSFRCALTLKGGLRDCDPTQITPEGRGFADSARKLLDRFQADMGPSTPESIRSLRVVLTVRFSDHAADPGAPFDLTQPDWLVAPDPGLAAQAFPSAARAAHVASGRATLACRVAANGALADCKAVGEEPAALGFGAAAVQVAAAMRVNGWTRDGEATAGARIVMPLRLVDPTAASAPAPP